MEHVFTADAEVFDLREFEWILFLLLCLDLRLNLLAVERLPLLFLENDTGELALEYLNFNLRVVEIILVPEGPHAVVFQLGELIFRQA